MTLKNKVLFFSFIIIALLLYLPSLFKIQDLQGTNDEYKAQIKNLTLKNENLLKERKMLEEDPEYLEKVARQKMRLMREGEVMYRITEEIE
ncbi:septum formation initiator family protein [Candidatus Omnitrophota bacterium]